MATTASSVSSSATATSSPSASSFSYTSSLPGPTIANFLKLSETNYLLWTAQLRPFLIGHGLFQFVDGTSPAPPLLIPAADDAAADPNPAYLQWFQRDQLVVSYLVATMTEPMLSLIVGKSTALEMWLCLKDNFSQQSVANAANIRFQLMDMSKGTKSISAYLQHAKSLSDSLAAICEPVSSSDLVTAVLRGLGSDYAMIVTAILNFPPLPRFEDLRARLLSYESQLQRSRPAESDTSTALLAAHSPSPAANLSHGSSYGRGQSRGGRHGRRNNFRGRGRAYWNSNPDSFSFGSGRGTPWHQYHGQNGGRGLLGAHPSQAHSPQWCPTCSTPQHSLSNCPHRFHGPESLTAPFAGMHVAQYPPPPDLTWYPDTGATHHMTSTAPPDSVPYSGNTSVLLGNGASLPIINTGNIPVSLGSHTLSLNNVFHVPSLHKNLLSVARFTKDNSVSFTFTPSGYIISDLTSGVPLFQGQCKDGLYPFSQPQPCAMATTASNIWHLRLGHPSSTVLRHLGSSSLGSTYSSSFPFCNDCATCKSHQLPFFSNKIHAVFPFSIIHSDVWMSSITSVSGFKYYVLFTDEFSRYSWIYPMRRKSEVQHQSYPMATLELLQLHGSSTAADSQPSPTAPAPMPSATVLPCSAPADLALPPVDLALPPAVLDPPCPAPASPEPSLVPSAAALDQPAVPPVPSLPVHHMTTRLRDGIRQPKVRTDGTVRGGEFGFGGGGGGGGLKGFFGFKGVSRLMMVVWWLEICFSGGWDGFGLIFWVLMGV
ncbi:hypothetical protein LWI29_013886 [Acer saccharum]|uniref:GAG-pre-integrase domain-containing protein n=1 Tax=Acer saccharum TaxID=4024 RepID=A0AA39VKC7_ACESA|nr:hypothetical protein LWI29_013886 [Acer saccharum]